METAVLLQTMDVEARTNAYKFVAFASIAFSVVAVLSICTTIPLVQNYIATVKSAVDDEVLFCKVGQYCVTFFFFVRVPPKTFGRS